MFFFLAERLGDLYQYWSVLLPDETAQTFALREKIKKKKRGPIELNFGNGGDMVSNEIIQST